MNVIIAVIIVSFLCCIVFSLGRIYEIVSEIRELKEQLEEEIFEREMMKKELAELEKAYWGEGAEE